MMVSAGWITFSLPHAELSHDTTSTASPLALLVRTKTVTGTRAKPDGDRPDKASRVPNLAHWPGHGPELTRSLIQAAVGVQAELKHHAPIMRAQLSYSVWRGCMNEMDR